MYTYIYIDGWYTHTVAPDDDDDTFFSLCTDVSIICVLYNDARRNKEKERDRELGEEKKTYKTKTKEEHAHKYYITNVS